MINCSNGGKGIKLRNGIFFSSDQYDSTSINDTFLYFIIMIIHHFDFKLTKPDCINVLHIIYQIRSLFFCPGLTQKQQAQFTYTFFNQ